MEVKGCLTREWLCFPQHPHFGHQKICIEDLVCPKNSVYLIGDEQSHTYQLLTRRVDHNNLLAISLLGCWQGTLASFTNTRRSLWPDEEFYSPGFLEQRMRLSAKLALNYVDLGTEGTDLLRIIRLSLEPQGNLTKALMDLSVSDNNGATLLHGLAGNVGLIGNMNLPRGHEVVEEWISLSREVIERSLSLDCLCQVSAWSVGPHLETPLLRLIQRSFSPLFPLGCQTKGRKSLAKRIQRCESSISSWLECLHVAGVNLREYGREEKRQHHVNSLFVRKEFEVGRGLSSVLQSDWWDWVRLISFDFGESPSQWKFWWSEMTDAFAGQFWDMVAEQEISGLKVPGAWVED